MATEPSSKRTIAFVDGQNLFFAVKDTFGYPYPNYDVEALAASICRTKNWLLTQVRFYTGIPASTIKPFWHQFWTAKLAQMGRQGVHVFKRLLRYRNQTIQLPNGQKHVSLVGQEKGIDVRLALDVVSLAYHNAYDVALIFSQDQDLSEVADEIRQIAQEQARWIKIACAYPSSPVSKNNRGVNGTDWIPINRQLYDSCLDPKDYRPKTTP